MNAAAELVVLANNCGTSDAEISFYRIRLLGELFITRLTAMNFLS